MKRLLLMIFCFSILLSGCSNKTSGNDVVATVNESEILLNDYIKTLKLYKIDIEKEYGESIWDTEAKDGITYKDYLKDSVINQMIDMEIIYQDAKEKNLLPTQSEINESVEKLKSSIENDKDYKTKLEENEIDDKFIEKQQEINLSLDKYKKDFDKNVSISNDEIAKYYQENIDLFTNKSNPEEKMSLEEILEIVREKIADEKYWEFIEDTKKKSQISINNDIIEKIVY